LGCRDNEQQQTQQQQQQQQQQGQRQQEGQQRILRSSTACTSCAGVHMFNIKGI
jgi:transcription initiation factor TFIID subunit TAF12